MSQRVLLIEDDPALGAQVVEQLRDAGYLPSWWREGRRIPPDGAPAVSLVILDLMLPNMHGMDVLKQLRGSSEVPILVLSARRDAADRVRALQLGADDYLTKPFWPDELLERVRARLRRPTLHSSTVIEVGTLSIDLDSREVRSQGNAVRLTRVEFELLAALARRPGAAVTRSWLATHVLDSDRDGDERTLDVHVSRIRRKLAPSEPVETVWGIGYRLKPDGCP